MDALKSASLYKYRPLPEGFIRLMFLEPATDGASPIHCTFVDRDLANTEPGYVAISYCWGTKKGSRPVYCYGAKILVTPNCEDVLRRLRSAYRPKTVWIDSICIDQITTQERNHQVALMGMIYKSATQVIIWLGRGNSSTATAFETLSTLGRARLTMHEGRTHEAHKLLSSVSAQAMESASVVFEMPWFSRLWTVQEVTLPNLDKVLVCCGDSGYPWDLLLHAGAFLQMHTTMRGRWDEATRLQRHISGLLLAARGLAPGSPAPRLPERSEVPSNIISLRSALSILINARQKMSTKPEDRIFALYGIFQELGISLPLPDYNKPIWKIFTEATIACIEADQSLDFLIQTLSDSRRTGLPSWVPDWSSSGWDLADVRRESLGHSFRATGSSKPSWDCRQDMQLFVNGFISDSIREHGPALHFSDRTDRHMQTQDVPCSEVEKQDLVHEMNACFEVFNTWLELTSHASVYRTGSEVRKAFIRMVFYDGTYEEHKDHRINAFMRWHDLVLGKDINSLPWSSIGTSIAMWQDAMVESSWLHHTSLLRCVRNKSFFLTEKGFFGVAMKSVRTGDQIALVAGVRLPMIVRRAGDGQYHYLTYAVVDGYMNGQHWTSQDKMLCLI